MASIEHQSMIAPYIKSPLVHFLSTTSRDEAIAGLIDKLEKEQIVKDKEAFLSAILSREQLVSTGIGLGVAIPHAKLDSFDEFFIAIGIAAAPGIEWDSVDGLPVRLIFLIGGPAQEQSRYLKILSALTEAIRCDGFRHDLLFAHHPIDVVKLFERI